MPGNEVDDADGGANEEGLKLARQVALVVQRLRRTENLTLDELADRTGLHRTHIGLVERAERHLSLAATARIASALGLSLANLIAEAEREFTDQPDRRKLPTPELPSESIRRRERRRVNIDHFENEDVLREAFKLGREWLAGALENTYGTLDLIDEQLAENSSVPLSQTVELANLSSMVGNLIGGGLAKASGGRFVRNRPHAYPDLLSQSSETPDLEVKTALETNKPKGHLPKEGWHMTFRYVLADHEGTFVAGKDTRGDTVWIWEVRFGYLEAADYDISNTAGDSGKTAVIKTTKFKEMVRAFYNPNLLPYATRTGPYGDAALVPRL